MGHRKSQEALMPVEGKEIPLELTREPRAVPQSFLAAAKHMAFYCAGFPLLWYEVGLNYLKVPYKASVFLHVPS